ncbi:hypothetical protein [Sulfurimonas paralvinellae]|uniref:Periplasmic protein n=1 Tax=Sulfurimonas paralvinellae TaxID=317658 RepID=A0A7M1B9P8_9BACT|nr:hypothetical protein [Sulfurimonas paralvinellae]QOP46434.1 hypothetical protein FM071_09070 [Sulfurimonas paralvinellae]
MVKFLLSLLLLCTFAFAEDEVVLEEVSSQDDNLTTKIKSFLNDKTYEENKGFINVIFDPKSSFYQNDRVDAVKVVQTLKENGLLKLFFKKPQEFRLNFKTNGSPLFFVKLMGDTLRSIGYYRYVTTASNLDSSEFTWSINLTSEYATDPLVLQTQLQKSSCNIIDIEKNGPKEWTYVIDITKAKLNVQMLQASQEVKLKRSLYAHWLDVSKIRSLKIKSSRRNSWYPYIAYYDSSLHLVKILKRDKIYKEILLNIPKNATYIKISDLYTLKNVRDELILLPKGRR